MLESKFANLSTNKRVKPCKCKTSFQVPFKRLAMIYITIVYLFNLLITQKSMSITVYLNPSTQALWRQDLRVIITIFTFETITNRSNNNRIAVCIFIARHRMRAILNNQALKQFYFLSEICRPRRTCLKTLLRKIGNQAIVISQHRQDSLINDAYILFVKLHFFSHSLTKQAHPPFTVRAVPIGDCLIWQK